VIPVSSASRARSSTASSFAWFSRVDGSNRSAGQPAPGQRAPRDDPHVVLLGHGQHVTLDTPRQQRVRRLLGGEPAQATSLGDPLVLDDAVRREGGGAEGADLALTLQVGQCGEGLVVVGARVGAVHLVQVDPVGLQPLQTVLDLLHDPASGVAALVRVAAGLPHSHVHGAVELGRQDDAVAAAAQRLADDRLRLALGVDVGGVDEVDAGVQRLVDDRGRGVVVGLAPGAEHHGAEAERADEHPGVAEVAVLHRSSMPHPTAARRPSVRRNRPRFT